MAAEICDLCHPDSYVAVEVQDRLLGDIRDNPPKGFRYVLTDAWDLRYNPGGKSGPTLPDGRFNLIHGKSWLTHVTPEEFGKYLPLFFERLVPGGYLVLSCFVDDRRHGKSERNCLHVFYSMAWLKNAHAGLKMVSCDRGGWTDASFAPHDIVVWKNEGSDYGDGAGNDKEVGHG